MTTNECPNCHLLAKEISPCKKCGTMTCECCQSVDGTDCMACVLGLKDFTPGDVEQKLMQALGSVRQDTKRFKNGTTKDI